MSPIQSISYYCSSLRSSFNLISFMFQSQEPAFTCFQSNTWRKGSPESQFLSNVPIRNHSEPGAVCAQRPDEFLHRFAPTNCKGKRGLMTFPTTWLIRGHCSPPHRWRSNSVLDLLLLLLLLHSFRNSLSLVVTDRAPGDAVKEATTQLNQSGRQLRGWQR